jgi:hypothetical protein
MCYIFLLWARKVRAIADRQFGSRQTGSERQGVMTAKKLPPRRRAFTRTVRMTEEERRLFDAFCEAEGVTPSEGLRRLARSAALLGPAFAGEARGEIAALTRQLRAVGTNLNQAVRHMNAGHLVAGEAMQDYLDGVATAIDELDTLYRSLCVKSYRRALTAVRGTAA